MTDPGLRDLVLNEGRKQARIHGFQPAAVAAEIYAEGWRAAVEASQAAVAERERELSLARRERSEMVPQVLYDNLKQLRDEARAEAADLATKLKLAEEIYRKYNYGTEYGARYDETNGASSALYDIAVALGLEQS